MTRDFLDSFKRSKVFGLLIFSVVELLNPLNLEQAFAQANFYKGKTITMVVASTTGGGYDLWARLTARYIVKYIPGNPSIIVQNMPGARQYDRRQLRLRRRQARRLDAPRGQSGALFRSTGRTLGS